MTGAATQRIDDVDTSQQSRVPAGWETPTGGGLNLVTDFQHDDLGRIIQSLGPIHTIDVGGVATSGAAPPVGSVRWLWNIVDDQLRRTVREHPSVAAIRTGVERDVLAGSMTPESGARRILDAFGFGTWGPSRSE